MDKYKCNNVNCSNTFSIADNREPGGENDPCVLEVECSECGSLTYVQSYNHTLLPHINGGIVKSIIEGRLHEHPEFPYPIILDAPEGIDLKENQMKWQADGFNLWKFPNHNLEIQASLLSICNKYAITHLMQSAVNDYLKGNGANTAFYIQDYRLGKFQTQAVWCKPVKSECDLNPKDYYLVHHSRVDLEKNIDGLFTRDEAKVILERLLVRWKFLSNQVVIATPFIGFDNIGRRAEVRKLWDWLDSVVDMNKTKFLTRKSSYKLLKESYDTSMVDANTRCEWQLLDKLTAEAEKVVNIRRSKKKLEMLDNAPVSFFQQFHAKFYAGIFDNHVEVLVGSYNVHTGKYYDNLIFKRYSKEKFLTLYMHKLCPLFKYKETVQPHVLVTRLTPEHPTCTMESFSQLLETIKI